jgi:hypothetical protein
LAQTDQTIAASSPSKAQKQAQQRADADVVWKQVQKERQAVSDKTARLRALRLSKEAEALQAAAAEKKAAKQGVTPRRRAKTKA